MSNTEAMREALEKIYDTAWRNSAGWAGVDHTLYDMESRPYKQERDEAIRAALAQSHPVQGEHREAVAEVIRDGATVRLQWASADAAHNAIPGPLFASPPLQADATFPQKILELLRDVADRKGTETKGPWEDGDGQPMQDDADAALAWITAKSGQADACKVPQGWKLVRVSDLESIEMRANSDAPCEELEDAQRDLRHIHAMVSSMLSASPTQVETQPELKWCAECGEGFVNQCRARLPHACPMLSAAPSTPPIEPGKEGS